MLARDDIGRGVAAVESEGGPEHAVQSMGDFKGRTITTSGPGLPDEGTDFRFWRQLRRELKEG